MNLSNDAAPTGYTYVSDWQSLEPDAGMAIADFWRREGALHDDALIEARLPQVVMHVLNGKEVAAVATAVPQISPLLGQPVYYYRSFVGLKWRSTMLIERLLKRAMATLEDHAAAQDFPCIGVLLELESPRFVTKGRMPIWPHSNFVYIGKSPRGLELRVRYFSGAKLKAS